MKTNSILQLLEKHKVVIPPIQRDYAQGRTTPKISRIRDRFLNAIVDTLTNDDLSPLELDFVYGYTYSEKTGDQKELSYFKPLDGQQRLTTLFLIHWYVAVQEGKMETAIELLRKFSYATRYSSRLFCENLVAFKPDKTGGKINEQIVNQPWFFSTWKSDPTISSMLEMLKEIELKFSKLKNIWSKLAGDSPRIVFHLLPMKDLGLPDDLYIKMNSRGKELTDFEHFKSQFSDLLGEEEKLEFKKKIDKEWSDLFWNIFKSQESKDIAKDVDSGFLGFFWYVTNILIAKKRIETENEDWLIIIHKVYENESDNVDFLFRCLDLFVNIEKQGSAYFESLFYVEEANFELGKTRLFFNNSKINLFRKCAQTYGYGIRSNSFSVGEQLLLYAIIYSEFNNKENLPITIRTLRNLFSSSEDQLRNEYLASFLYEDVEKIINSKSLSDDSKLSKRQLQEEYSKDELINDLPEVMETVYKLEDHNLLRGNISILHLDITIKEYAERFHATFNSGVQFFEVSRAMLTIGNYSQKYRALRRFGNNKRSVWRELLTQSEARKGFENTKLILKEYLDLFIEDNSINDTAVIGSYLDMFEEDEVKPKTWRYYYIKYDGFRTWYGNQTDGFYKFEDISTKPYESTLMFRKQFNGRHWSPYLLELSKLNKELYSLENFGNDLQYTNGELIFMISHFNEGFKFEPKSINSENVLQRLIELQKLDIHGTLAITKNEQGIDIEDRILKCNSFLNELPLIIEGND